MPDRYDEEREQRRQGNGRRDRGREEDREPRGDPQGYYGRTMEGDYFRQAYGRQGDFSREGDKDERRWDMERRPAEDWMNYSRPERSEEWRQQRGQGDWGDRGSAWNQGRSEWPRESRPERGRGQGGESWARGREESRNREPHRHDFAAGEGREDFGSYDRETGSQGGYGRSTTFGGQSDRGGGASSFGYGGGMTGYGRDRTGMGYGGGVNGYTERGQFSGKGPKGYKRSDDRIREEINERLTDHPEVDASEIEVQVQDGNVTLAGSVDNRHAKRQAEDLAEQVSGVKDVQNQIRVQRAEGGARQATEPAPSVEPRKR